MALIGLKPLVLTVFALFTGFFYVKSVSAAEPLGLKLSGKLDARIGSPAAPVYQQKPESSLLGKINFFKGVEVKDDLLPRTNQASSKTSLSESEEKPEFSIKPIYGGVQFTLQENLSLVYTPGRLSSTSLNGEGEGLYLLTNRGGLAKWFFGVESSTDSTPTNPRRDTNSAQVGVIFSLD